MESGAEDLFFPRLIARRACGRREACSAEEGEEEEEEEDGGKKRGRRARRRESMATEPSEGKPYRLIMAESSGR